MAGQDIRAGGAFVEVFLKGNFGPQLDKLQKKFQQFGQSVSSIGKEISGYGAAITAPLILAGQRFAEMGDEINKASQRTGVGVEQLTALKYAAEQSGASMDDLESGIRKMQKAIFEAASGSDKAREALAGVGLTVEQLKNLKPDEQFVSIAEGLSGISDPAARAAEAMEIFGKGGVSLIPMLADGADGINKLVDRAQKLGVTFSKEDAAAATVFSDTLRDLWKQVQAVTFQVGAAVSQALMPFLSTSIKVMTTVINWAKQNRTLIIAILGIGAGLLAAGAALIAFGVGMSAVGSVISGVMGVVGLLGTAIGLLLNPIVLVGVGLVALAGYLAVTTEYGAKALAYLGAKFGELKDTAKEAFGGIADALGAGDIQLAAQILWTGLKLAFTEGTIDLQKKWAEFKAGFVEVAGAAFYGVLQIWADVKAGLETTVEDLSATLQEAFQSAAAFMGNVWSEAINSISQEFTSLWVDIEKGLNHIKGLFDEKVNVKALNDQLDHGRDQNENQSDKQDLDDHKKRDDAAKQNIDQIEKEHQKTLDNIKKEQDARTNELNGNQDSLTRGAESVAKEQIDAINKQKADLQKQLDDLRKKAGQEKAKSDKDKLLPPPKIGQGLDDVIDAQKNLNAFKSNGIFNSAGIQSLQGNQAIDPLTVAAQETAKNTKKILDKKGPSFV